MSHEDYSQTKAMASVRRLTIIRTVVVACSVLAIALPGILIYEEDTSDNIPVWKLNYLKQIRQNGRKPAPEIVLRKPRNSKYHGNQLMKGQSIPILNAGSLLFPDVRESSLYRSNKSGIQTSLPGSLHIQIKNNNPKDSSVARQRKENNADGVWKSHDFNHARKTRNRNTSGSEISTSKSTRACKEMFKVAFLKTHKTGSTTVMNVLQRFGHVRNLVFVLPKTGNYLGFGETVSRSAILPAPKGKSYDMLINHVVYNRVAFRRIMPKETVYVTIIRHPLEQFVSAIEYLKPRVGYLKKLPKENAASAFLHNATNYETKDFKWSFTNNRMSFDLGLDHKLYHNATMAKQFVNGLDQDFKLVMITEYLDESLLLLKKYLCWSFKDILYIPRNVNVKKLHYNFTAEERQLHKAWASADYTLYEHFLEKFNKSIVDEGPDFEQQSRMFKKMLLSVRQFCTERQYRYKSFKIKKTRWNDEFEITGTDCRYMLLEEVPFLRITMTQYWRKLRRSGFTSFNSQNRRSMFESRPIIRRRNYGRHFNSRGRFAKRPR